MKTRFLFMSLGILFLLSACKTESFEETQTDFQKELTNLSTKKFELFSTTRSNTSEFNTTVYRELIEYAIELSKQYNVAEKLRSSGYYKDTDGISEDLDFYEALRFIETNSTPEFYTLVSEIIYEGNLSTMILS